jgi:hypothetical protein
MPDSQQIPSEIPVLYVNSARLAMSYTDIRLFLGESVPANLTEEMGLQQINQKIIDRICIVLSPEVLPQLINGLSKAMENYQSIFGQLRPMPQFPIQTKVESGKADMPHK